MGTLVNGHFKVPEFPHPWGTFFSRNPQYLAKPKITKTWRCIRGLELGCNLTLIWFFFIFDFQENNLNVFTITPIAYCIDLHYSSFRD